MQETGLGKTSFHYYSSTSTKKENHMQQQWEKGDDL